MKASDDREFARQHKSLKKDLERIDRGSLARRAVGDGEQVADLKKAIASLRTKLCDHFAFEEGGGYLQLVVAARPTLKHMVDRLRSDHDAILGALDDLVSAPGEEQSPEAIRSGFIAAIRHLRKHEANEMDLVQRTVNDDLGVAD